MDYLTTHTSLSPIRRGFATGFVNYKNRCTRLTAASDKVYQLLAHGRWFSPSTPASSTTKTGRHFEGRIQGGRPPKIGKNMIFWRKIVIFHTKYPKIFRVSLRNWKEYDFLAVKSCFFTRNTPKFFSPPFARRNFFKCAPPP